MINPTPYASVAARLVDNGYSVIPCMPGSKFPGEYSGGKWYAKLGWQQYGNRLPTEYEVPVWERWPDAGVCLVLDQHIKVVDIDTEDEDIRAAILSVLPETSVKKRGQKGFSAFYRGSPDVTSKSFNVNGVRALDFLAHGKQTVLPPTIHPDTGKPYTWIAGSETLESVTPECLEELPDDIVEKLSEALEPFGYVQLQDLTGVTPRSDSGGGEWRDINNAALENLDKWVPHLGLYGLKRNQGGYRAVASFRPSGSGKPMDKRNKHLAIHSAGIRDWGDDDRSYTAVDLVMVCLPCKDTDALEWLSDRLGMTAPMIDTSNLIKAGLKKHSMPPATPLSMPDEAATPVEMPEERTASPVRAPAAKLDPFTAHAQGGLMGAVTQWMYDSAWRPVPEFATIGALGFCSALFGRRYAAPTGLGLNLYLIGIAGSGFGKDHPLKAMQALMADAKLQHLVGPGDITSDSALEYVLRQRPAFVMPMDEIGVFFQATGGRNSGGYERRIRKVFLDLYTKGDGMWTGKQKVPTQGTKTVTDTAAEPIYNPTVSIMGMSTPTEFYAGISEQNLSDGMVGRMTVIAAQARPTPREDRAPVIPPLSLVKEVQRAVGAYPVPLGNIAASNWRAATQRPPIYVVPWASPEAKDKWRGIEEWQLSVIDNDPSKDGIVGRAAEQTIKLATLRACSRSQDAPAVTEDDVEWGWAIVSKSLWNIEDGAAKYMSGGDFEKLCKDIIAHVEAAGGQMPKSVLLRKRGLTKEPRLVSAALLHLSEAGVISPVLPGGRSKVAILQWRDEAA